MTHMNVLVRLHPWTPAEPGRIIERGRGRVLVRLDSGRWLSTDPERVRPA